MGFLTIDQLTKRYGKQTVLEKITVSVEKGEFVVLLGPSGCGKSTLLNCVAGLLKYEDGKIMINEMNMNEVHPSQRNIAMVFQSYALYPNMSVRNNISFGMKIRKESPDLIEKKIAEVSDVLNITELLDRRPSELSGGQQQRVAIGRALVRNPQIFLFDEPLSNLDAKLRVAMRTEIKRLHRRLGTTIIYVTHDQVEAMSLADKIAVMDKGHVVQFGTPDEVYFRPNCIFVAEFIGSPPMNLLPCRVDKKGSDLVVNLENYKEKISLTLPTRNWTPEQVSSLEGQINKDLIMGIRPENIHCDKGKNSQSESPLSLKVELVEPNGADNLVITDCNGKEIIVRLHSDIPLPKLGESVEFYLDMSRVLFYSPTTGRLIY